VTYDALVVGGGPAGTTSARLLARAGWTVALVEKSAFPRRKVCGEFISATSQPVLMEAGIGEEFLKRAGPEIKRVGLFAKDLMLSSPMPHAKQAAGMWGRALGRDTLDTSLLGSAVDAGAKVWQPAKLIAVERRNGRFIATVALASTSIELKSAILIAANGSWEPGPLSRAAAIRRPDDLFGFKAHFADSMLPSDLMPLLVFPGGYGGLVHTDGDRLNLSCCIRRDVLQKCRENLSKRASDAVFMHIVKHCEGARCALRGARLDGPWLSAGPIRPGIRQFYSDGVFFVGNSAGEAHPVIAEGISMAMQSAWILSRGLIAGRGKMNDPALREVGVLYGKAWKDALACRLHAAALFARSVMQPNLLPIASLVLKQFPQLLSWCAALSGKAKVLSAFAGENPGLQAH
jgi:flavin-dependent dehydrogenase